MTTVIQKARIGHRLVYRLGAAALGLLALAGAAAGQSSQPPKRLLEEIAANGSLFLEELNRYTYRQSFHFIELDKRGARRGDYLEVRDITFSPEGERVEEYVKGPFERLKYMRLTEEDFRDLRDVQPFVLTEDTLWLYETDYQGAELLGDRWCYVYRVRPRQILEGQRFLDGQIWVDQEHLQVIQVSGQPVPQLHSMENANLFPHFVTIYEPVDGKFWFPVKTEARDTLAFPSGLQPVRYEVGYEQYRRFSADSKIVFGEAAESGTNP